MISRELIEGQFKGLNVTGAGFCQGAVMECNSFFESFREKIPQRDIIVGYGAKLEIPRIYLFGTQPANEYTPQKRSVVENRLAKCGVDCLKRNPPFVVPIFDQDRGNAVIAILDGHNRIRYSGQRKFGILTIPTLVLSLEEVAEILNKIDPEQKYDAGKVRTVVENDRQTTLDSFGRLSKERQPRFLPGVSNMEGLLQKFPAFT